MEMLVNILFIDAVYGIKPNKLFSGLLQLINDKDLIIEEMRKTGLFFSLIKNNEQGFVGYSIETSDTKGSTSLKHIMHIFKRSSIKKKIANKLVKVYTEIGKAESIIHKTSFSNVHLHEIGSPAAILYAVGIFACLDKINASKIFRSKVGIGCGKIKCSHGILDVPAPCTKILTRDMKKCSLNIKGELTTPLGAAIISLISEPLIKNDLKNLIIYKIGLGWSDTPKSVIKIPLILCEGRYV